MINSRSHAVSCPLEEAVGELSGLRRRVFAAMVLPPILSVVSVLAVRHFDRAFLTNPILVCVLALFIGGQVVLAWQLILLKKRADEGRDVLRSLKDAGPTPDISLLERNLSGLAPSPMRDLLLGWVDLELRSSGEGAIELMHNSMERRSLRDQTELGVHAMLNRVVLKIGFLGTLIGLLLTFPPMKRAVLGLSESDGELAFIRDIAKAIDEDAYAIQATLVATGLSLLLETLVVQILERFFCRFELVESLLSDWNLTVLRPASRERRQPNPSVVAEDNLRLQVALGEGQKLLDENLRQLLEVLKKTGESVETVARNQQVLETRIAEISQWERDYREFLVAKEKATGPAPRGGVA